MIPLPRVVIVDYDIDGVDEEDLTHFSIGAIREIASCHCEIPSRYEELKVSLSPKAILAALGEEDALSGANPEEKPSRTPIESSLADYLAGYIGNDPFRRREVLDFPDWPRLARRELEWRSARLLEGLPDEALNAIAQGKVDLARLVGKIPG